MFVGLRMNTRGNYSCLFCAHKSWKSESYGITHVENKHPKERADLLAKKLQEAQSKPPRVEYRDRERVVYKDKPEPKYWEGSYTLFCTTCKTVSTGCRIPRGQTIEETPHNVCGTRGLIQVTNM